MVKKQNIELSKKELELLSVIYEKTLDKKFEFDEMVKAYLNDEIGKLFEKGGRKWKRTK